MVQLSGINQQKKNKIANYLGVEPEEIVKVEEWWKVYFVVVKGKRPTFVSKKTVSLQKYEEPFFGLCPVCETPKDIPPNHCPKCGWLPDKSWCMSDHEVLLAINKLKIEWRKKRKKQLPRDK